MKTLIIPAATAALLLSSLTTPLLASESDANYVPYSGSMPLNVLQVETPTAVRVRFESYPGFNMVFRVNLPGVVAPSPASDSGCERQMAADALAATEDFLGDAREIDMRDMRVITSTDEDGYADIHTNQGSLRTHLRSTGLVRPADTDPAKPWCDDEE